MASNVRTRVAVVGAGSWGTAFASLIATNADVVLWAREPEVAAAVNVTHQNPLFLEGVPLAAALTATASMDDALADADAVVLAVPSAFYRSILERARQHIRVDQPVVSLTKGIEGETLLRMSQVAGQVLADHDARLFGVLTGPNLAKEIALGQPAASVLAMEEADVAARLQRLFITRSFRVYTNPDIVGCELGGSVKNVIALAAGMSVGLGFGENAKAALVTRGLAELTRLGVALGAQPLTFLGLAGIGDLVATCSSPSSRNRHVGEQLARGRALAGLLSEMRMVAEGVETARPVVKLARRAGVEMPISEQVAAVLAGDRTPGDALTVLMEREATPELHGIV
jgi:glycerol-3-phosphate dehydrogenase (NAD(P)+)